MLILFFQLLNDSEGSFGEARLSSSNSSIEKINFQDTNIKDTQGSENTDEVGT